jgi:hypothetical protein
MIIAAPQHGHTKVGGMGSPDASAVMSIASTRCFGEQELTYPRQVLLASGIGDQPIVTDAMESAGQHVQQETTHELVGIERHGLVARTSLDAIILPAEGDTALVQANESPVGDSHPVGIAGQIRQHRGRPGKRRLA